MTRIILETMILMQNTHAVRNRNDEESYYSKSEPEPNVDSNDEITGEVSNTILFKEPHMWETNS